MYQIFKSLVFVAGSLAYCGITSAHAAQALSAHLDEKHSGKAFWKSSHAQHVYGLPDVTPGQQGTLSIDAQGVSFTGKSDSSSVQWHSIIAFNAASESVELWGDKGRLLRLLIPFSGGLAIAAFSHHRVDDLTVEFRDSKGGYHGAVFRLPSGEAPHALARSVQIVDSHPESQDIGCERRSVQSGSVFLRISHETNDVPPAYRALLYEHLVDRLRRLRGMQAIYREGQQMEQGNCPQFEVHLAIAGFRSGNQVLRASTGPIGMFISPTKLTTDVTFSDLSTGQSTHRKINSTVRDDSESWSVADKAAKSLAKHFSSASRMMTKPTFEHQQTQPSE